jgi:hypothetical protein
MVLRQEHLAIAVESDQEEPVLADVRPLVKHVADHFAVREDDVLPTP